MISIYDKEEFYRAHLARDSRFDGQFFVAVKTTMIYCRPICPARKAQLQNLEFYIHAAQAEEAGFRPCRRCRPETAPGSTAWIGTSATIQRAIRLMDCFATEEFPISELAVKLGVSERWLRELFQQQVGVSPSAILMSRRLDIARNLLDQSTLSITEIAFSSGFQSLRRFNDAFKTRFQKSPRAFRKAPLSKAALRLQLSYRSPYAWDKMLLFLKNRALPQLEWVNDNSYQRLITYGDIRGWFKATQNQQGKIEVEFKLNKTANIMEFVARLKNIFDLDCDPMAIENNLKQDSQLTSFLNQHQGLRIPGCWDGFELAVRAIIGQKISVKAARTVLSRLVENCGESQSLDESITLTHFFPTPENILGADLSQLGLTQSKILTLQELARQVMNKNLLLDGTENLEEVCRKLLAIKGIGRWTVEYIAMRALRNPNAFPATDLELQKKISRLQLNPEKWAPWRAYGAILLWNIQ
jgi:AraC family transcriptional regulator, regulatory protein of adaptative response / DNA-3-methyladenine glycosylase II